MKKRDEQRLEAARMKFLRHLLGITKIGKYIIPFGRNLESGKLFWKYSNIKESGYREWTKTGYPNKQSNISQKREEALDIRRKDRRTNFTLWVKEEALRLTL